MKVVAVPVIEMACPGCGELLMVQMLEPVKHCGVRYLLNLSVHAYDAALWTRYQEAINHELRKGQLGGSPLIPERPEPRVLETTIVEEERKDAQSG